MSTSQDFTVQTTYGTVRVAVTDRNHAYIEPVNHLTVNGTSYHIGLHVARENGEWGASRFHVSKSGSVAPPKTRDRIERTMLVLIKQLAEDRPEMFEEAQRQHVSRDIERRLEVIATHETAITHERALISQARATVDTFPHRGVTTGKCPACGHSGDDCKGEK